MDLSLCLTNSQHINLPRPSTERSPRTLFVKKQLYEQTWAPKSARQTNPRFRHTQILYDTHLITDAPISPEEALKRWKFEMTRREYDEILEYREIYYVGQLSNKVSSEDFDDMYHYYKPVFRDQIAYRYEIKKTLMKDILGTFVLVHDHRDNRDVVLQILVNTPEANAWGEAQIQRQNLVQDPENNCVMKHFGNFVFRGHLVFEYEEFGRKISDYAKTFYFWSSPLHPLDFPPIELNSIRKIAMPIITGIRYLHSLGITHGNITPTSIYEKDGKIRIVNYGYDPSKQLLRYRAPEVIMGFQPDMSSDMFSFGLVLCELVNGKNPFTGRTDVEQFALYIDTLGMPPRELISQSPRARELLYPKSGLVKVDRRDMNYRIQNPIHVPGGMHVRLSSVDSRRADETLFYDLVKRCVCWRPYKRISAEDAFRHPWFYEESTKAWKKQSYSLPALSLKS